MENKRQVILSEENLTTLENMIGEIPTKMGLPMLDYLKHLFIQQNKKQADLPVIGELNPEQKKG